jgi:2-oxoglutarate ferredoxin oxidoreductase subunit alpha
MARIAKGAMNRLREKGKKVGLIRLITLWPFPKDIFKRLAISNKRLAFLAVEMSYGQMVEDVKLSLDCKLPVRFLGRAGGGIPAEEEIINKIKRISV